MEGRKESEGEKMGEKKVRQNKCENKSSVAFLVSTVQTQTLVFMYHHKKKKRSRCKSDEGAGQETEPSHSRLI
jgi:hypothetical protein